MVWFHNVVPLGISLGVEQRVVLVVYLTLVRVTWTVGIIVMGSQVYLTFVPVLFSNQCSVFGALG